MKPVEFRLSTTLSMTPESICDEIFDASNWSNFQGYGPIPGIVSARRSNYSDARIGTRFEVVNADGSSHVETVVGYEAGKELVLRFGEFSKPLAGLASHFVETWRFDRTGDITGVERSFQLFPRNIVGKVVLSLVSIFLERAVRSHLAELEQPETRAGASS